MQTETDGGDIADGTTNYKWKPNESEYLNGICLLLPAFVLPFSPPSSCELFIAYSRAAVRIRGNRLSENRIQFAHVII